MFPPLHSKKLRLGAMLLLAVTSMPVAADTVQMRYFNPASTLNTPLHLPTGTREYVVGSYNLLIQSQGSSFQAYCVDPFQYSSTNYLSYERTSLASFLATSQQKLADVGELFAHAYANSMDNAIKSAGFQLALWEVFNDNKNLTTGSVYKTTQTHTNAVEEANTLLAALANSSWTTPATNYELTMFSNSQKQDFLAAVPAVTPGTVSPVPEPESTALVLAGLSLLGLASRGRVRRRRTC